MATGADDHESNAMGSPAITIGSELDERYRLLRRIGAGGMGDVFEAEDRRLMRRVAVKVLRDLEYGQDIARQRLLYEARLAACAKHPNIVEVYELGAHHASTYVVMELLHGEDLQTRLQREHTLPVPLVERIAAQLASALVSMHGAGIVHRDLKPGNLFLAIEGDAHDVLKVLDFGVAKDAAAALNGLTETGQVFGTPLYMAPEQLRGAKYADAQSDLWSVGAVLYEALSGHPPFEAECLADLVLKLASGPPTPVERWRPDTPPALAKVVRRALQRDPALRLGSALQMQDLLQQSAPDVLEAASTQAWFERPGSEARSSSADLIPTVKPRPRHLLPVLSLLLILIMVSSTLHWLISASPKAAPAPASTHDAMAAPRADERANVPALAAPPEARRAESQR